VNFGNVGVGSSAKANIGITVDPATASPADPAAACRRRSHSS
jgi:hypothetical protein